MLLQPEFSEANLNSRCLCEVSLMWLLGDNKLFLMVTKDEADIRVHGFMVHNKELMRDLSGWWHNNWLRSICSILSSSAAVSYFGNVFNPSINVEMQFNDDDLLPLRYIYWTFYQAIEINWQFQSSKLPECQMSLLMLCTASLQFFQHNQSVDQFQSKSAQVHSQNLEVILCTLPM